MTPHPTPRLAGPDRGPDGRLGTPGPPVTPRPTASHRHGRVAGALRARALPAAYLSAGIAVGASYYLVPAGRGGSSADWKVALYCSVTASAAVAVMVGIVRYRPVRPAPWYLICFSQVIYATGDVTFYVRHNLFGHSEYPSISDLLYLVHYAPLIAGILLLVHRRTPDRPGAAVIDAGIIVIGAAVLSWIFVISPQIVAPGETLLARTTSVAYPLMDLLVLAVAMWLFTGSGRRPPAFWLLMSALVLLFSTDTIYALQQLAGTYDPNGFLGGMWLGHYLLLGAAALDPSMRRIDEPVATGDPTPGVWRLVGLGLACVVVPIMVPFVDSRHSLYLFPVVGGGTAALFALVMVRMTRMVAQQREMAVTDPLTGLRNRRYFETHLEIEAARACRSRSPLAFVIFDIDFFKAVNDEFGHSAGDEVLREVAERLRRGSRAGDVLARYGGEEFAALLVGVTPEKAAEAAERMRQAIGTRAIALSNGGQVTVTVSGGIVVFPDHVSSPESLVIGADRALYAAKSAGRDRLVMGASDPPPAFLNPVPNDPVIAYLQALADRVDLYQAPVEHGSAIARWAVAMAHEMGLDDATQRRCQLAARLHDIGKVAVPSELLAKSGSLSDEQWALIRAHPAQGEMLVDTAGLGAVGEIIAQHHEWVDGTGYPRGLTEPDIRIEARILSVCDTFASMRGNRPYRPGLSEDEARKRLLAARGSQLSGGLVDLFVRLLDRGVVGHLADLSQPLLGTVAASTPEYSR